MLTATPMIARLRSREGRAREATGDRPCGPMIAPSSSTVHTRPAAARPRTQTPPLVGIASRSVTGRARPTARPAASADGQEAGSELGVLHFTHGSQTSIPTSAAPSRTLCRTCCHRPGRRPHRHGQDGSDAEGQRPLGRVRLRRHNQRRAGLAGEASSPARSTGCRSISARTQKTLTTSSRLRNDSASPWGGSERGDRRGRTLRRRALNLVWAALITAGVTVARRFRDRARR